MPKKTKLTNRFIKDLRNDTGKTIHVYDSDVRGFCVTVTPMGSKSFYYVGRINGRSRRVKLGPFPEMTSTEARNCCRETVVDAQKGVDTQEHKRTSRRTLGELFTLFLNTHAKIKKRTWERDVIEFEKACSHWKRKPISEIRRGMVADLIAELTETRGPGAAHRVRALLSKMFTIAVKHEWCEYNPVTGTDRPTSNVRERYLRPEEVFKFFAAVEQLQREISRDFIKVAVFTGARRSNLCTMEWDELDFIRGIWTIPKEKYKGKRTHVVPLIEGAIAILKRREESKVPGCRWVFPGGGKTGHIVQPKSAMNRVKELAGIENLRFHDLRRSMGAWQNNSGTSIRVIQQTLGHANIATTAKHYSPNEAEVIRQSMQAAVDAAMKGGE